MNVSSIGSLDLPTQAAINSLLKAFQNSPFYQSDSECKATKDPHDTENGDSELKALAAQFDTNLDEQKAVTSRIIAEGDSAKEDWALARSLQLQEYNVENQPPETRTDVGGATASNHQERALTNGFENLRIHVGLPPPELCDWHCSCSKIKLMSNHQITSFEDLFERDCKNHRVVGEDGKSYIRVFHGTSHDSLESFETRGIQAFGNGDLGRGFYVAATFEDAGYYGMAKSTYSEAMPNYRKELSVIEILVPLGLTVKKYMHWGIDNHAEIEQHYQKSFSNKFICRQAILHKLRGNKQYIVASDDNSKDNAIQQVWAKTGKSSEEIEKIIQKMQINK